MPSKSTKRHSRSQQQQQRLAADLIKGERIVVVSGPELFVDLAN